MRKLSDKIAYLQEHHFSEWLSTRKVADEEVSKQHPMWCVCGRLCTGMHENGCSRFKNKVNTLTVKKLSHLLPVKTKTA